MSKIVKCLENRKITDNFWLHEFIAGTEVAQKGQEMAWEQLKEFQTNSLVSLNNVISNIEISAKELQYLRDIINFHFKVKNNNIEIGIEITSGYRPVKCEIHQKRKGTSQHTKGHAKDIRVTNIKDDALYNEIMLFIYNHYDIERSWSGGLAYKNSTLKEHKKRPYRFIHIDHRKNKARWTY